MGVKLRFRKGRRPGESAKYYLIIHHNRKRRAKCVGTDKRFAEQARKRVEAQLALGALGIDEPSAARPFSTYFKAWLATYARTHCKASTCKEYDSAYRIHLLPHFGDRDIAEITRDDVKALAYGLQTKGRARATVRAVLAPLREMYSHAIEDGHVSANPATRVLKRSRLDAGARRAADFLTREELAHLLTTCREHFPRYYPFVLLLARTGMRLGEALALQWDDIDWHGRFAEVRRSLSRGSTTAPKSGKSRRVDLSAQLVDTLRVLRVASQKRALRDGRGELPAVVFASDAATPLDGDNFRRRVWPRLFAKAELREMRIHDLRHTYASLLIGQGESLTYVKEQLGHASIQTTVDVYGHLVPGGNRAAVDRLDDTPSDATKRNPDATAAGGSDRSNS